MWLGNGNGNAKECLGLRDLRGSETLLAPVHVLEKEQKEKGDRVHVLLQCRQVLRGAPQLHRHPRSRPPWAPEAVEENEHVL